MPQRAKLYRMVTPEHICPFGLKSRDLLRRNGFDVEDHLLRSKEENTAFERAQHVDTTPQTFIEGKRIGGYDDLRIYFGLGNPDPDAPSYAPVIAVFAMALAIAVTITYVGGTTAPLSLTIERFVALSMCLLALQKLRDLESFTNQFLTYDLLARRIVRYAYVYPFVEAYAGLGMLAQLPAWLVAPAAIFIGTIGAASVIRAVYIEHRELKCACVGGNSNVPLGLVSLMENLLMIAAGIAMSIAGRAALSF